MGRSAKRNIVKLALLLGTEQFEPVDFVLHQHVVERQGAVVRERSDMKQECDTSVDDG